MATPFKMKGHTLPGPKQKVSPMKEPFTLAAAGIIAAKAAIAAGVVTGISAIAKADAKKKAEKIEKESEAKVATKDVASSMEKDIGTKTKIV